MKKLSERKILKKKLAKAIAYRKKLPQLIDCSIVYGDGIFTEDDYASADKMIGDLREKIAALPVHPDTIRQQKQAEEKANK